MKLISEKKSLSQLWQVAHIPIPKEGNDPVLPQPISLLNMDYKLFD